MDASVCSLCTHPLGLSIVKEDEETFCCAGCRAVYRVLQAQGALATFSDSPLYREALRSGLISNPHLHALGNTVSPAQETLCWHAEVEGLWCPSCAEVIHLLLAQDRGIHRCYVDYATDIASIVFDPIITSKEKISSRLEKFGYKLRPLDTPSDDGKQLLLRGGVAAFFAMNTMMLSYPIYASFLSDGSAYTQLFAWLAFLSVLPTYFYCGWPILKRGITTTWMGILGMETLVVLGTGSAFVYSFYQLVLGTSHLYFDTIGVIITFLLLGKYLEGRAKFSIKATVHRLARSRPRRGRLKQADGASSFVPIDQFAVGDHLLIFAGEKIVLDGIVAEGSGACNEAMMTGEVLPVIKKRGDRVVGGSFLQQGTLTIEVTSTHDHSTLHHLVDFVERDLCKKTSYHRAADKVIPWFVPAVLIIAALTYVLHSDHAFLHALSVLVVACPCALGIAAPLAESALLGALAQKGFLVRNRAVLETLGKETSILFDKTGTLTEGNFAVIAGLEKLSIERQRQLKGLAMQSLHPLACAIAAAIPHQPSPFDKVEEHIGRGLEGSKEGAKFLLGSEGFLKDHGVEAVPLLTALTPLYFACEGEIRTVILLDDPLRHGAKEALRLLQPASLYVVSGDAEGVVKRMAAEADIEHCYWRCHPLEKRGLIEQLQKKGECVAFIGDGINDAPALAAAEIGITVMTGSEVSLQAADVVLTTGCLSAIAEARTMAVKGRKIIQQNLFWAFVYNGVAVICAAAGVLSPLISAGAMVLSSVIVVLNARRCGS